MKKFVLFVLILVVNFSLFAAPPGKDSGPGKAPPPRPANGASHSPPPGNKPPSKPGNNNPPPHRPGSYSPPPKPDSRSKSPSGNLRESSNFRGQRIILSDTEPKILKSSIKKNDNHSIEITLNFNHPVNPGSLRTENIFVNDVPLKEGTRLIFNKKADSLIFEVDGIDVINIVIKNIEGINGKKTEVLKVNL